MGLRYGDDDDVAKIIKPTEKARFDEPKSEKQKNIDNLLFGGGPPIKRKAV